MSGQRVDIFDTSIEVKKGTSGKSGKPYEMREQIGYLHVGRQFPVMFKISLERDQQPFAKGSYTLENGLEVGEFDSLRASRHLKLVAITPAPAAK